jgi:hypothetical protein
MGAQSCDLEPIACLPRPSPRGNIEVPMSNVMQWLGVGFGLGVIALGLAGFFRGLSLPPNPPEHRSRGGKGQNWRT